MAGNHLLRIYKAKYSLTSISNQAGDSDPSQETKPHLCRYKNLAPGIDKVSKNKTTTHIYIDKGTRTQHKVYVKKQNIDNNMDSTI